MTKLTQKQLDRASKIAMKGLILPNSARLVALRNLNITFTPLLGEGEAKKFIKKEKGEKHGR